VKSNRQALYFGCYGDIGHFLFKDAHTKVCRRRPEGFPWSLNLLDMGLLKNGKVSGRPTGMVYRTMGGSLDLWHAFYWWDRSVDKRPGSNSGFYVRGFNMDEFNEAFEYACEQWPKVVERQTPPLTLVPKDKYRGRPEHASAGWQPK